MTTFTFNENIDNIEAPKLLAEEWYGAEIADQPALADSKSTEGNKNLVVKLRLKSDVPEESGRVFTIYLPYPVPGDEEAYDGRGMKVSHAKMERIKGFCEAFTKCSCEGNEVTILPGGEGLVYVIQRLDQSGQEMRNDVDTFAGFKSPDAFDVESEISAGAGDTPFD